MWHNEKFSCLTGKCPQLNLPLVSWWGSSYWWKTSHPRFKFKKLLPIPTSNMCHWTPMEQCSLHTSDLPCSMATNPGLQTCPTFKCSSATTAYWSDGYTKLDQSPLWLIFGQDRNWGHCLCWGPGFFNNMAIYNVSSCINIRYIENKGRKGQGRFPEKHGWNVCFKILMPAICLTSAYMTEMHGDQALNWVDCCLPQQWNYMYHNSVDTKTKWFISDFHCNEIKLNEFCKFAGFVRTIGFLSSLPKSW